MKPLQTRHQIDHFFTHWSPAVWVALAGLLLGISSGPAQTTNMAELRELRVACLESFNTAKTRLDELHGFVGQQAEREHAAANQLFTLQQNAATAKQRNGELQQQVRECTELKVINQLLDAATKQTEALAKRLGD